MAVEIGTAADYLDLLTKLRVFVTGLAGGQAWTVMRNTIGGTHVAPSGELILRAPGLGGTDQIFTGIQPFAHSIADYYNWRVAGFTGYSGALTFATQPGTMQNVMVTLWDSPIPYWLVANGRRAVLVAKVSTSYVMMYLGFINQYHSPSQYPYPLLIGGNMAHGQEPAANDSAWRWSLNDNRNHNFPMSSFVNTFGVPANTRQARLRTPNGVWGTIQAQDNGVYGDHNVWPYSGTMASLVQNLGATPQSPLLPLILSDATPEVYGEIDGVFATSGQGIASEDLLTVGADNYLVVQDVFRTGRNQYCAVKLA